MLFTTKNLLSEQCCGSGMFIPDPDFYPFRISDPGSKNSRKGEGWKQICCHIFFCSHKFHIIENYFILEMLKKIIWANLQKNIQLFTQKIVTKLSKKWVWDPGSWKNLFRFSGSKKHRIPDPQHCFWGNQPGSLLNITKFTLLDGTKNVSCARNYRPSFRENQPKMLVFIYWIRAFWACFHGNAGL